MYAVIVYFIWIDSHKYLVFILVNLIVDLFKDSIQYPFFRVVNNSTIKHNGLKFDYSKNMIDSLLNDSSDESDDEMIDEKTVCSSTNQNLVSKRIRK